MRLIYSSLMRHCAMIVAVTTDSGSDGDGVKSAGQRGGVSDADA